MDHKIPSETFVKGFYELKTQLLKDYFDPTQPKEGEVPTVAEMIKSLDLDYNKKKTLYTILDGALTDVLYTILLSLDGNASIGNTNQQLYKLLDEEGNELTNNNIESYAWEYFHNLK